MIEEGSVLMAPAPARTRGRRGARRLPASRLARRLRAGRAPLQPGAGHESARVTVLTTDIWWATATGSRPSITWSGAIRSTCWIRSAFSSFSPKARGSRAISLSCQKATKLDFASWGGFAQNYAGRRIPFARQRLYALLGKSSGGESEHSDFRGLGHRPVLPGAAMKGALRTALSSRTSSRTP